MRRLVTAIATLSLLCAAAGTASANVYVDGTGEPAFTNTTTNTQFIHWQGSSSYGSYQLEYEYLDNGVLNQMVTQPVTANGSATGSAWWTGVINSLVEGHTYGICVYGRYTIDGIPARDNGSCLDGANQNKRTWTTIDRTKPVITVAIDNGAAYSKTGQLDYRINYSDNLAYPFPANFICRDIGTNPADACYGVPMAYDAGCSVPNEAKKLTFFSCVENVASQVTDGPVTLCVRSADAAVPDKPNSANQSGEASQANLSERVCDSITVDRTAPSVGVSAPKTSLLVGEAVQVTATASDATSGVSGNYSWNWGDGSADGSGISVAHSYSSPGEYVVKVTTGDGAGNSATASKTIVVSAPPAASGGGTQQPPAGESGTPTAPGAPSTPAAPGNPSAPGTPAAPAASARLDVSAPKRIKGSPKTLALALSSDGRGRATFALVRAGRIHAQGAVAIASAGTKGFRLKLPRRLAAGKYQLKVVWTPAGATAAQTRTLGLAVVGRKAKKKTARASSASAQVELTGAPTALPDGKLDAPIPQVFGAR